MPTEVSSPAPAGSMAPVLSPPSRRPPPLPFLRFLFPHEPTSLFLFARFHSLFLSRGEPDSHAPASLIGSGREALSFLFPACVSLLFVVRSSPVAAPLSLVSSETRFPPSSRRRPGWWGVEGEGGLRGHREPRGRGHSLFPFPLPLPYHLCSWFSRHGWRGNGTVPAPVFLPDRARGMGETCRGQWA